MASFPIHNRTALLLGFTLVLTSLINCRPVVSRQKWDSRWGPLVPHKTFPGDCGLCHVPTRWDKLREDFSFDHEKETGHALEGAHAQAACLRCHNDRGPVQVYVERGCGGCHPDPHAGSLGLDCERCHDQGSWRPTGLIAEHARTRFPLMGIHAITPCENCHIAAPAGQYRGAPTACELCHQEDLARALSPDHQVNAWTTDCQRCHVPATWLGTNIRHDFFPLTGGHGALDCSQCHTGGVFTGLSQDCYPCHTSDYQGAPDHVSLGYSQTCNPCHTISAWSPSTFRHRFPLTGHHNLNCNDCHTTGNVNSFSCIDCHDHRQSEADSEHNEVSGYVYSSPACYQCHPNGRD